MTTAGRPAGISVFLPFMLLLFVGSGCAALIYEIVWLQLLQLVIGLTAVSLGVLLGTFMGGMCLGSLLLPRLISSRAHPLRVYAMLEAGIGLVGIAVLFLVPAVEKLYTAHGGGGFSGILLRAVVSGVCLLPPTLLMGATLPAISRWVETTPRGVSWLGFFYGGNIVGAVFGCLLAGFYLLRVYDMAHATYVAACINGAVALLGFLLAALAPRHDPFTESTADTAASSPAAPNLSSEVSPSPVRGVYWVIALSGFCALGAEVIWTRLLSLMLGATVYTFSIILAVFLIGLGIGSTSGAYVARNSKRPRVALGICQMLLAAAIAWCSYMITKALPNWPIDPSLTATQPWFTFQVDMARAMSAILPAACLWGASFPLALAAASSRGQDPGRLVGGVYAANTVGAILGSLGFSLVVVPLIGTQGGQRVLIIVSAISALVALVPVLLKPAESDEPESASTRGFGAAGLILGSVGAITLAVYVGVIPWGVVAYGRWVATYKNLIGDKVVAESAVPMTGGSDTYCIYMGEGYNGTVAVTLQSDGIKSFHSAGKVQASNDPRDMRLQRMLGHISALAVASPKNVLVVACGAGVTAGSFVVHPDVTNIVICDIEPLVPDHVATNFTKENYDVVHDPRVHIVHDDGRHFIRTTKEKFDVITSDPIDPWVKGCAALNTVEYYQMCKDHLNPGGVMSLWIPLYESNGETIKSVLATFFHVFTNGIFWSNDQNGEGYDAVLFGQADGSKIDIDKMQARIDSEPAVKQSLADVGFHSANDLLATYAGRASDLQGWMQDAQINWDSNLRLQYLAGLWLNNYNGTQLLQGITKYYKFPDDLFIGTAGEKTALQEELKLRQPSH
jgi:spermidine synthase